MSPDPTTPAETLAAVRRSREAILDRVRFPWWAEPVHALAAGVLIAGQALPGVWSTVVALCVTAGWAYWGYSWTNRTGLSLGGLAPGRTRWVTLGWAAGMLALFTVGFRLEHETPYGWAPVPAGVLAALMTYAASRLWLRLYRAELRDRP